MFGEAPRAQGLGKLVAKREKRIKGLGRDGRVGMEEGKLKEEKERKEECLSHPFLSPLAHLAK